MIISLLLVVILLAPSLGHAQSPDAPRDTIHIPRQAPAPIRIEVRNLMDQAELQIDMARNAPPEVNRAERLMREGEYDAAAQLLEPLFEADPSNKAVASSLKRAYQGLKDYEAVKEVVTVQLGLAPSDAILLAELADNQFLLGESDAAKATIDKILINGKSEPDRYNLAARAYINAGRYTEGIATYRQGRKDLGDSLIFAEDLGRLFEARREYAAAVDEHFRWLAARPESRPIAERRITSLIKVPEAIPQITEALQRIVASYPRNEYAHSLYGDLLFESGHPDSAFAEYRRADGLSSTPGAHQAKGIDRCLETKQYEEARQQALAFLQQFPDHSQIIQVNLALARAELGLNRPAVAVDMLKKLAGQFPIENEQSRIEFEIGEIYRTDAGDMDSAQVYFSRVAARSNRDPLRARSLMRLGDVEVGFGNLFEADSIYREALRARIRQEDREEVQYRLAELRLFHGEYTECAADLKKLVGENPRGKYVNDALELTVLINEGKDAMSWSLSRYAGALYAIRRGQYDTAATLFSQIAQDSVNKMADEALFHLAGLWASQNQYDSALASYRALIVRYPDSFLVPRAYAEIGGLFEGPLDNPEEARRAYQTILTDYRDSPVVEEARLRLQRLGMVQ